VKLIAKVGRGGNVKIRYEDGEICERKEPAPDLPSPAIEHRKRKNVAPEPSVNELKTPARSGIRARVSTV
jgi:hypothetical protein